MTSCMLHIKFVNRDRQREQRNGHYWKDQTELHLTNQRTCGERDHEYEPFVYY